MALTRVTPNIIAVANNVTNKTVGNTTSIPSFTFDGAGVVTSASNVAISGAGITANTVANSAFQTGSVESYLRANALDFGMRNRIINGQMAIAQRGTSAVSSGDYPVDRFIMVSTSSATTTAQQSSTVPSSTTFSNSVLYSVTTGASSGASDRQHLYQRIEGFNTADLGWGTANAKSVTLSFWAYASIAGTYSASFSNSAQTRSYVASYTLPANTWTQVSLTVAGDTSGTWLTTNGIGIQISWDYGSGSSFTGTANTWSGSYFLAATGQVALSATTGATFYITGVQLEVGTQATSFEYRQYGQELALCQRYFYLHASGTIRSGSVYTSISNAAQWDGSNFYGYVQFPTTMRSTPTLYQNTGASYYIQYVAGVTRNFSSFSLQDGSPTSYIIVGSSAGGTVGQAGWIETQNASALLAFTAEL